MATETEAVDFDADDPSYRACYIFQPSDPSTDIDHERPRKKRKTTKNEEPDLPSSWPKLCHGDEPPELAEARQLAFGRTWSSLEPKLQRIADEVDQSSLNKIDRYIDSPSTSKDKLRAAIVPSGTEGKALRTFLSQRASNRPQAMHCEIRATQAPNIQIALKSLIKDGITSHSGNEGYNTHIAAHKRLVPMLFDLELLQIYASEHDLTSVVLSINDAETFDLNVLSELISHLTSWKDRIPFILVLTLASTVSLFESRMSKSTMRLMDTEVFPLGSKKDKYFELFSVAQLEHDEAANFLRPLLGPATVGHLYEMSQDQSVATHAFIQALKYCYLTHFFANPLSAVLTDIESRVDTSTLCESIRNTGSFQQYCTAVLEGKEKATTSVQQLLESDTDLLALSKICVEGAYEQHLATGRSLRTIARVCHVLDSSQTLFKHYHYILQNYQKGHLDRSKAYDLVGEKLPLIPQSAVEDMVGILGRDVLKAAGYDNTLAPISPPALASFLTGLLDRLKPPTLSPYLAEAFLITRTQLSTNFVARPRFAISRALSSPSDYLVCDCCASSLNSKGTDAASILYRLLDEAGREVNVMDLWTTFRDNILSSAVGGAGDTASASKTKAKSKAGKAGTTQINGTSTPAESKGKAKKAITNAGEIDADGEDSTEERSALTQFYTALATLKYLGLVKSTSDRRLNRGVEVLSKVAWQGL